MPDREQHRRQKHHRRDADAPNFSAVYFSQCWQAYFRPHTIVDVGESHRLARASLRGLRRQTRTVNSRDAQLTYFTFTKLFHASLALFSYDESACDDLGSPG